MLLIFANYGLIIGALLTAVFIGYKWMPKWALAEIEQQGRAFKFRFIWTFLLRYVCPIAIAFIFGYIVLTQKSF